MDAKLPVIFFGVTDVAKGINRLKEAGISVRTDLDNPEWGWRKCPRMAVVTK